MLQNCNDVRSSLNFIIDVTPQVVRVSLICNCYWNTVELVTQLIRYQIELVLNKWNIGKVDFMFSIKFTISSFALALA